MRRITMQTRNPKRSAHLNPFYPASPGAFCSRPCAILRLFALIYAQLHFKLVNSPDHTVFLNPKHSCHLCLRLLGPVVNLPRIQPSNGVHPYHSAGMSYPRLSGSRRNALVSGLSDI
jgi:hypothetical protein